jgi:PAS domain S-box-containing protein
MAIVMLGQDLRIRRFTPMAEKTFNLIRTDVGRPISDIKLNIDVPDLEQLVVQVIDTVSAKEQEVQDKQGRWYSLRIRPYRTLENKIDGAVLVLVDVHTLKRAEEARRESEERLNLAMQGVGMGTWDLDAQTGKVVWSETRFRLLGYEPVPGGEATMEMWRCRIHPDDREGVLEAFERAGRERSVFCAEHRIIRADNGQVVWLSAFGRYFYNERGEALRFAGVSFDITERKRAEERFRLVVEAAPNAMIIVGRDGKLSLVNKQVETLFGYAREELLGHPVEILVPERFRAKHPGYRDSFFADPKARPMGAGRDLFGVRKDGSEVPLEIGLNPIQTPEGLFTLASIIDITERKRLLEDLHKRVGELADADRIKNEFLAMLGHELRGPLAPIRNALHILRMPKVEGSTIERVKSIMEQQVRNLTRLVDDLLDVSRITRGTIQLQKEKIDLAAVVGHAVESVRPLIELERHELLVSLPQEPVHLEADPTRLEQILTNLLHNAAKFTEAGGQIWLTAQRDNAEVVVCVRDTGIGIAPELLPSIFDMFTQAGRTLDRSQGGLGIGLALVRRLVELHGGSVRAHSNGPGKGSEFVVRVPALPPQRPEPSKPPPEQEPAKGRTLRVLVVEDDLAVAEMLVMLLELWGHTVQAVHDGPAALAAAPTFRPEVVLCDIGLPGMNGYQLVPQLRQQEGLSKSVLVAMTGYGQEEDRRHAQEAGFDHHMTKPVDPAALEKLLTSLV